MSSLKISVIVPAYNAEKTLHRCVDSILAQTFEDFELILVDDGSKDSSGRICDEYAAKDSRIRVVHKSNGGVSSARNAGLDIASGEYVAFIDSDDYIDNDYLLSFTRYNADLIVSGATTISNNKTITIQSHSLNGSIFKSSFQEIISEHSDRVYIRAPWSKAFSNAIIKKHNIRFDNRIRYAEDYLFTLTFIKYSNNISFVQSYGYNYIIPQCSGKYRVEIKDYKYGIKSTIRILKSISDISDISNEFKKIIDMNKTLHYVAFYDYTKTLPFSKKAKHILFFILNGGWLYSTGGNILNKLTKAVELSKLLLKKP